MGEKWIRRADVSKRLKFLAVSFNSDEVSQGKQPNCMLLRCRFGNKDWETRTYCCKDSFPKSAAPGVSLFHHLQALDEPGRPPGGKGQGMAVESKGLPSWALILWICILMSFSQDDSVHGPVVSYGRRRGPFQPVLSCLTAWWSDAHVVCGDSGHGPVAPHWKQPGDPGWVHVFPFWKSRTALVYLLS